MAHHEIDYAPPGVVPATTRLSRFLRKRWKRLVVFGSLIATVGVAGIWIGFGRHISEAHSASATEIADLTGVMPPPQAMHVWASRYTEGGGQGFASYVRFEAPPAICIQYASKVVSPSVLPTIPHPCDFKSDFDANVFKNTAWFDLAKAGAVVEARGNATRPNVRVWVDVNRGVFYFMETD